MHRGQGSEMTLTFHTFISSIYQDAIVSELSSVVTFSYRKACYQIWPCCEIGQGQPKVIICTNNDGLESQLLHTNFQGNASTSFGRRRFLKLIYHTWVWQPSWSCDSIMLMDFHEKKMFEINDGQTPDHGYTVSSPMNIQLRWAKKSNSVPFLLKIFSWINSITNQRP